MIDYSFIDVSRGMNFQEHSERIKKEISKEENKGILKDRNRILKLKESQIIGDIFSNNGYGRFQKYW